MPTAGHKFGEQRIGCAGLTEMLRLRIKLLGKGDDPRALHPEWSRPERLADREILERSRPCHRSHAAVWRLAMRMTLAGSSLQ